jgi:hypothetical protein
MSIMLIWQILFSTPIPIQQILLGKGSSPRLAAYSGCALRNPWLHARHSNSDDAGVPRSGAPSQLRSGSAPERASGCSRFLLAPGSVAKHLPVGYFTLVADIPLLLRNHDDFPPYPKTRSILARYAHTSVDSSAVPGFNGSGDD